MFSANRVVAGGAIKTTTDLPSLLKAYDIVESFYEQHAIDLTYTVTTVRPPCLVFNSAVRGWMWTDNWSVLEQRDSGCYNPVRPIIRSDISRIQYLSPQFTRNWIYKRASRLSCGKYSRRSHYWGNRRGRGPGHKTIPRCKGKTKCNPISHCLLCAILCSIIHITARCWVRPSAFSPRTYFQGNTIPRLV